MCLTLTLASQLTITFREKNVKFWKFCSKYSSCNPEQLGTCHAERKRDRTIQESTRGSRARRCYLEAIYCASSSSWNSGVGESRRFVKDCEASFDQLAFILRSRPGDNAGRSTVKYFERYRRVSGYSRQRHKHNHGSRGTDRHRGSVR